MKTMINIMNFEDSFKEISLRLSESESFAKIILAAVENDFNEISKQDLRNTILLLIEQLSNTIKDYETLYTSLGF